ncbi:MAG: hypothetical protein NTY76_05700 [Candidatus Omnitrophica bacterium]|nr:hypothetical protein [Candidatus Omnitrophota bacterium]
MIEYYGNKKLWMKAIAVLLVVSFVWYDIAWAGDLFYYNIAPKSPVVPVKNLVDVTNYDLLSNNKSKSIVPGLLPTNQEKEESNKFAPAYIQDQEEKHEGIIRQKQDTEDLLSNIDQDLKNKINKPGEDDLELKKKRSNPEGKNAGGIYYTLEDYNSAGRPGQINVYKYAGDDARHGKLLEIVSYDLSKLDTNPFTSAAKEIKTDSGDSFMGSYTKVGAMTSLIDSMIISRTVYAGNKSEERIDYILSAYDEKNVANEVTIYDYNHVAGPSLDETRTYNITASQNDYSTSDWKNNLTEDKLTRLTVYTGTDKKENISYSIDTFLIDEDGKNTPHQIVIYDRNKNPGEALDEVRTYEIDGFSIGDLRDKTESSLKEMNLEDPSKLVSVSVYQGEKDKEKIAYILSDYFDDTQSGLGYRPWTRTDYTYDGKKLTKTEAYDISDTGDSTSRGTGKLNETVFYTGEANHERMSYSYTLYDANNAPQLRIDHDYDGRTLRSTKTYAIAGLSLDSTTSLQDESIYSGKAGREQISRALSYYPDGKILKETLYTYNENTRGISYVSHIAEKTYDDKGMVVERIETEKDLNYTRYDIAAEDANGNIRHENIKTYSLFQGVERLDREEDVNYSGYKAKLRAGFEARTTYAIDETTGERTEILYQEVTNELFNPKGNVIRQTIESYTIEHGEHIHDYTKKVENRQFDYYNNVLVRIEEVRKASGALVYYSITENTYDNLLAAKRGNASKTAISKYSAIVTDAQHKSHDITNLISEDLIVTTQFDSRGFAVKQENTTYLVTQDAFGPVEKLVTKRYIENLDIDDRGDAHSQHITVYQTDATGLESSLEFLNYQELTNRKFDSQHNVINQMIATYSDEAATDVRDVQEVRSIGFYSSGVAMRQVVAMYTDKDKTSLVDIKVTVNSNVSSLEGNVGTSIITSYANATIADNGTGDIIYTDPIDVQTVETTSFDARGNALEQSITKEYYDNGILKFSEAEKISNFSYDFHDRVARSQTLFYTDKGFNDFSYLQDVKYLSYDKYGNALEQTIDTYTTLTPVADELINHKRIVNNYDLPDKDDPTYVNAKIAWLKGNPTSTETFRYIKLEETETNLIERTFTTTDLFDKRGNAVRQTSSTYIKDPATGILQLQKETTVENINIDNRGDAGIQHITTKQPDPSNANELTIVTYQVITNRHFDASHSVDNQMIYTYTEPIEAGGTLLDVQEIRSEGFHSSGTTLKQTIVTYASDADGNISITDAKVVENDVKSITPQGYVGKTKITRYSAATIADTGTGAISLIPADSTHPALIFAVMPRPKR